MSNPNSEQKSTPPPQKSTLTKFLDAIQPFVIGGLSGMCATSVIQPVDTVKVRIQLISEHMGASKQQESLNPIHIAKSIIKNEGATALYKGLDSALIRQATYATARLGLYKSFVEHIKKSQQKNQITLWEKIYSSLTAGFLASLIGNPSDLILVRMQGDGLLPPAERRNYKHFFDALVRIIREESVMTLWRGSTPTVLRAMAVNLGTLAPYDETKDRLVRWKGKEDNTVRLIASAVSGAVGAVVCLPFDNIKTKLQRMKAGPDGKFAYTGVIDCINKTYQREGILKFWVGLPTFYVRVAPHAMITLLVQDYLTDLTIRLRSKQH